MTACPYCREEMEEGFIALTTDGIADMAWSAKPSILGFRTESLTGWALLAKNLPASRCQACRAVLIRY